MDNDSSSNSSGASTSSEKQVPQDPLIEESTNYLYSVLNVSKNATHLDIKRSFNNLSRQLHPDKHSDNSSEIARRSWQQVNYAYKILIDPRQRAAYDRYGSAVLKKYSEIIPLHSTSDDFLREIDHRLMQESWYNTIKKSTFSANTDIFLNAAKFSDLMKNKNYSKILSVDYWPQVVNCNVGQKYTSTINPSTNISFETKVRGYPTTFSSEVILNRKVKSIGSFGAGLNFSAFNGITGVGQWKFASDNIFIKQKANIFHQMGPIFSGHLNYFPQSIPKINLYSDWSLMRPTLSDSSITLSDNAQSWFESTFPESVPTFQNFKELDKQSVPTHFTFGISYSPDLMDKRENLSYIQLGLSRIPRFTIGYRRKFATWWQSTFNFDLTLVGERSLSHKMEVFMFKSPWRTGMESSNITENYGDESDFLRRKKFEMDQRKKSADQSSRKQNNSRSPVSFADLEYPEIGFSTITHLSSETGLEVNICWNHLGIRCSIPIFLFSSATVLNWCVASLVQTGLTWALRKYVLEPGITGLWSKSMTENRKFFSKGIMIAKKKADEELILMEPTIYNNIMKEAKKSCPLVICHAFYGRLLEPGITLPGIGSRWEISDKDPDLIKLFEYDPEIESIKDWELNIPCPGSPSDTVGGWLDCTRQLKFYMSKGRIILDAPNKASLQGFYDPCPGEPKQLLCRYLYDNKLHEVIIEDSEPLGIPSKSHLIE